MEGAQEALGNLEWNETVRTTIRPMCDPHMHEFNVCIDTSLLKKLFRSREINLQKGFVLGS